LFWDGVGLFNGDIELFGGKIGLFVDIKEEVVQELRIAQK